MIRITPARAAIIDERGAIEARFSAALAKFEQETAADQARAEAIDAEILEWVEKEPATAAPVLQGKKYAAVISARGNQSFIIDIEKVFHKLGLIEFFKWATIPLGELRKLLSKHEHPEFILTERTGPRSVRVEPLAKAVSGKAA